MKSRIEEAKRKEEAKEEEMINPLPQAGKSKAASKKESTMTPVEKEILKFEKKLREVEALLKLQEDGAELQPNQLEKVEKEHDIKLKLAELSVAREEEKVILAQE